MLATLSLAALFAPLALSTPVAKSTPLPLIIWHGLGDNYLADGLRSVGDLAIKTNPGTFVYYIHLAEDADGDNKATFFGNLTEQIAQVCADLAAHPILSTAPAVNALGFSQGGQFLRGYVQRCNFPPVRNLVTFGSQHNGIAKYQTCDDSDWLCRIRMGLLKGNTWTQYVQSHLVPAQYFRATDDETGEPTDEYLEHSNFLADINNERPLKNATYAANLATLNKFALYLFDDDTVVIPKESGWFAQTNLSDGRVTPLQDRAIYKEDWIGLKKLDERGALDFKTTKGQHMELGEKVLVDVFETYFAPPAKGTQGNKPKASWEDELERVQELIEL